jgi:hypothetical protein
MRKRRSQNPRHVKEDQAEMVAIVVVENYKSIDYYLSYNIIIN